MRSLSVLMTTDLMPALHRGAACAARWFAAKPRFATGRPEVTRSYDSLDGLRAILAIVVATYHFVLWTPGGRPLAGFDDILFRAFLNGHKAVDAFIVLSGFCLSLQVWKDGALDAKEFYKRRAQRILIPYYAALFLGLLVGGFKVSAIGLIGHLTLTQNIVGNTDNSISGNHEISTQLWSVAVECQIYLLFPAIVWLWRKIGVFVTALLFCVGGVLVQQHNTHSALAGINAHYYGLFCLGACGSYIAKKMPAIANHKAMLYAFIALLVVQTSLVALYVYARSGPDTNWIDVICGLTSATTMICAVTNTPVKRILSWRPLTAVGSAAYSIYLCHLQIISLVSKHETRSAFAATCVLLVPIVAFLFYRLFERPCIQWMKRTRTRDVMPKTVSAAPTATSQ